MEIIELSTDDEEKWREILPAEERITGSVEHVRIREAYSGHSARLLAYRQGDAWIAYPIFLRPAHTFPFAPSYCPSPLWDSYTPEYCGPLYVGGGEFSSEESNRFKRIFSDYCEERRVIAEFAHLHPFNNAGEVLESRCVEQNREIIYADLSCNEEQLWMKSLSSDARRQTKQGLKAGVSVERATSSAEVREFYRLYTATMDRRGAHSGYYYPLEYFLAIFETLPDNSFFVFAKVGEAIAAAGLFLYDRENVYWYLSAADRKYSSSRPVNVYLYETMRSLLGGRQQRLIMGGGYQAGDGVFRFKANFSPLRAQFRVYKRVHDTYWYSTLKLARDNYYKSKSSCAKFFPAYHTEQSENSLQLVKKEIVVEKKTVTRPSELSKRRQPAGVQDDTAAHSPEARGWM